MRAKAYHLRQNLANLETYIATVKSKIQTFNQNVKVNMEGIKARGERTDNLITNLFKAYQMESDT